MQHYNRMMIISGQWPSVSRCVCVCVCVCGQTTTPLLQYSREQCADTMAGSGECILKTTYKTAHCTIIHCSPGQSGRERVRVDSLLR